MQIKRYQEGGVAPTAPAQVPQGGEEQMMQQIAQMAQEIIQQLGPDAAAMLAQVIMEMLQGGQQEVGAVPEEQQFMRCGGKIKKKTCKKACGGSVKKDACGGKSPKCKTKKSCK